MGHCSRPNLSPRGAPGQWPFLGCCYASAWASAPSWMWNGLSSPCSPLRPHHTQFCRSVRLQRRGGGEGNWREFQRGTDDGSHTLNVAFASVLCNRKHEIISFYTRVLCGHIGFPASLSPIEGCALLNKASIFKVEMAAFLLGDPTPEQQTWSTYCMPAIAVSTLSVLTTVFHWSGNVHISYFNISETRMSQNQGVQGV